jgi:hypothetical protein
VKMSDIFVHSYITIGAVASTTCDESFLARSPQPRLCIPFHSRLEPEVTGQYFLRFNNPRRYMTTMSTAEAHVRGSKWNSRAWV